MGEQILPSFLQEFPKKRILVLGDLMVDEYITGTVSRISPEAPVAVLNVREQAYRCGGAANVAINIRALGASCTLAGIALKDAPGTWLREYLASQDIKTEGIFEEPGRKTIVKIRFTTKGQQLLRVDSEDTSGIQESSRNSLLVFIKEHIKDFDAVIFSDYRKGVLHNKEFISAIISLCKENNVLTAVDSKSRDMQKFQGADILKPNKQELENAAGIQIKDDMSLDKAGNLYLEQSGAGNLVVTRSEKGISLFRRNKSREDFCSQALQVFDVTGAGDTVIGTVTLGMCSGLTIQDSIKLANLAAGIVVSKRGTASVSTQELIGRINEQQNL